MLTTVLLPMLEKSKGFQTIEDDPFWFRLELLTDRHESETRAQINRIVKPGMIVLDIGAHVGYYTRLMSQLVGENGKVIAFEPHPRTFEVLHKNTANLKNVTLVQSAVAEEEGTAELYDYLMMSASGSLHYDEKLLDIQKANVGDSDVAPRIQNEFPVEKFTVRTVPIDALLSEMNIEAIDFVKMDIEGAEMGALRGMKNLIANSPNINLIMEFNPSALKAFDVVPESAVAEVLGLGFSKVFVVNEDSSLVEITNKTQMIVDMTTRLMQHMDVVNLLFIRS
ncbi:MAG: FkbM family methyltransferase [Aggregatilineales bacterium]